MYTIKSSTLGPVMTNCYTVINDDTKEAILIDASGSADAALKNVHESEAAPVAVLLTHAHFDHMDAVPGIKKKYEDIPVYIGEHDEKLLGDPSLNLSTAFMGVPVSVKADKTLKDGEEIELIGLKIRCIEVPGHTQGGMCYLMDIPVESAAYEKQDSASHSKSGSEGTEQESGQVAKVLFDGDTLFCGSIGRSDFPTGDGDLLVRSIREKILTLPEETTVCPGHDVVTTIKHEKNTNMYFMTR